MSLIYQWQFALTAPPPICKDPIIIVIRVRSSGYNGPRLLLVQIRLSCFHCYCPLSPQVTSNDKTPTVISSALEKHNQDPKQASRYELIQLLPEGKGKKKRINSTDTMFKKVIITNMTSFVKVVSLFRGDKDFILNFFLLTNPSVPQLNYYYYFFNFSLVWHMYKVITFVRRLLTFEGVSSDICKVGHFDYADLCKASAFCTYWDRQYEKYVQSNNYLKSLWKSN